MRTVGADPCPQCAELAGELDRLEGVIELMEERAVSIRKQVAEAISTLEDLAFQLKWTGV